MENLTNRQKKALETKKALFSSAISLFKEKGFENVHVDEIALKAGTSKGSFYTYFKSKDDVIIEHYKKIDENYRTSYNKLPSDMKASEKLMNVLYEGFVFSNKLDHEFLSIVLYNQLIDKAVPFVVRKDRYLTKIIEEIVHEGQANGEFSTNYSASELTEMILCFYKGIFLDWCLLKGNFNFIERGKSYLTVFIDSIVVN